MNDLDLVYARDHPSSSMRRCVATNNIDKLLKAIGENVHSGMSVNREPTTLANAELFETVEDLLRAAYGKSLEKSDIDI